MAHKMKRASTWILLVWAVSYGLSWVWEDLLILDWVQGACVLFFVIELFVSFRRRDSMKQFLKENWVEIVLLIPWFRLFKIGKVARVGKLAKAAKAVDGVDLAAQAAGKARRKHGAENF